MRLLPMFALALSITACAADPASKPRTAADVKNGPAMSRDPERASSKPAGEEFAASVPAPTPAPVTAPPAEPSIDELTAKLSRVTDELEREVVRGTGYEAPAPYGDNDWQGAFAVGRSFTGKGYDVVYFGGKEYIDANPLLPGREYTRGDGTYVFIPPNTSYATQIEVSPDGQFDVVILKDDCTAHLLFTVLKGVTLPPFVARALVVQIDVPHRFILEGACTGFPRKQEVKAKK